MWKVSALVSVDEEMEHCFLLVLWKCIQKVVFARETFDNFLCNLPISECVYLAAVGYI